MELRSIPFFCFLFKLRLAGVVFIILFRDTDIGFFLKLRLAFRAGSRGGDGTSGENNSLILQASLPYALRVC